MVGLWNWIYHITLKKPILWPTDRCDGAIGKSIHLETQQNMKLVSLRENLYPENQENLSFYMFVIMIF